MANSIEDGRCLRFRALLCGADIEPMIGEPASPAMEIVMPFSQRLEKVAKGLDLEPGAPSQTPNPLVECYRIGGAQRGVRPKRGIYSRGETRGLQLLVVFQRVGGIVA